MKKEMEKTSENLSAIARSSHLKKLEKACLFNLELMYVVYAGTKNVNYTNKLYTVIYKMKNHGISQEWLSSLIALNANLILATISKILPIITASGRSLAKLKEKKKVLNWLNKQIPDNVNNISWKTKSPQYSSNICPYRANHSDPSSINKLIINISNSKIILRII